MAGTSHHDGESRVSVRRDAWRAQLLMDELAEKSAARRSAAKMRTAVVIGVIIGAFGSVALYL
jgi:hypothetical protein